MRSEAGAARQRRLEKMRYPAERKRRFLEHLWETFDVDSACVAARVTWRDMCALRDEDPEFAAEWERVIAAGYERIEIMLLQLGGAAGAVDGREPDLAIARELVKQRGPRRRRRGGGGIEGPPKPDREREIASIMRKLRAGRPNRQQRDEEHDVGAALGGMAGVADLAGQRGRSGEAGEEPGPAG